MKITPIRWVSLADGLVAAGRKSPQLPARATALAKAYQTKAKGPERVFCRREKEETKDLGQAKASSPPEEEQMGATD